MINTSLENKEWERNLFFKRMSVAFGLVVFMLLVLIARLAFLQIGEHEKHQAISEKNRLEVLPLAPIRGLIYDRNGVLIGKNVPSHTLSIVAERSDNVDLLIEQLTELIELKEEQIDRFYRRLRQYRRPYEPIPLKVKLSEEERAIIAANRIFLQGVQVDAELIRQYPFGGAFAHVLGYVGRINERELERLDPSAYAGTRFIGKQGVERQYESYLLGKPGFQRVETNARGRIINVLDKQLPIPGVNLHLTLDHSLQQKAYQLLEGKRGAIVAIQPKTGEILALVSQPSFNPNLYVTGFPVKLYNQLRDAPSKPFLNRASQGLYPPASTIKPFIGLAGVDQGYTSWHRTMNDRGVFSLPNDERIYRDWKPGGHGIVNLTDAIEESVDTYFYDLAYRMTLEPIHTILAQFGFGQNTTLDVYNPSLGINPSRQWKRDRHGFSWYAGDTVNLGIGQGYMLASPLQLAIATMVFSQKGKWQMPRLLKSSDFQLLNEIPEPIQQDIILNNPAHWDKMHDAMAEVLYGNKGTARGSAVGAPYKYAGKTGTAQVVEIKRDEEGKAQENEAEHLQDHALFIAFAPFENPTIALSVVVEHGGGGSSIAAPIARQLLDYYLLGEQVSAE